jgi:transcriptional regulator with XRE-family HTH domain
MEQIIYGKLIRIERRKHDITQSQLSNALGWSTNNSYISNIENAKINITEIQFNRIISAIKMISNL